MSDSPLTYRIALSLLAGVDTLLTDSLLAEFVSERDILEASEAELKAIPGVSKALVSAQSRYQALEVARQEVAYISSRAIHPLWYRDDGYPPLMRSLPGAPIMLYGSGECPLDGRPVISIVGTRHATPYGVSFTERIIADLAQAIPDVVIVSGLAYGIDIAAHRAALKSGVSTIGVVAHGLATIYPAQHRDIAARIVSSSGAVLTEYIHGVSPLRPHFLARNRIIARMADATLVIESGEKGGALSTVRHAISASRQVFALPGRVTDVYSAGCNNIIASRAASLVTSAANILDAMGWHSVCPSATDSQPSAAEKLNDFTPDEVAILRALSADSTADNDVISALTGLPPHVLMATLIGLEMKGVLTATAGNHYQLLIPIDLT